ncbi:DUF397 domain-containing protein [Saccharopolyspora tripterygii]
MEFSRETWRKSTRSASNASCVEVAVTADVVGVRNTKDRTGGTLAFDRPLERLPHHPPPPALIPCLVPWTA